jgi:lipopolysaccharide/colanic/teichoic acid biosynthesis glycosyltransferase
MNSERFADERSGTAVAPEECVSTCLPAEAAAAAPPVVGIPRWKRSMDVVIACVAIVVLSPLLISVAIFIKCVSRGPVGFKQRRAGFRGESFTMLKFRTMHVATNSQRHCDPTANCKKSTVVPT